MWTIATFFPPSRRYMLSILTDGFHFSTAASFDQIQFVEDIGGEEASWPLGFMTDQTNQLESVGGERMLSLTGMVLMVVFGSLMIILGAVAIVFFHMKHYNRTLRRPE